MGNVIDGLADHVTDKTTQMGSAQQNTLHYVASGMKGWRNSMEDCHTLCGAIPVPNQEQPLADHSLFAVYDGHGGDFTSNYAGERFVELFSHNQLWTKYVGLPTDGNRSRADVTGVELLKSTLKATFLKLDEEVRNLHARRNDYSIRQASDATSENVRTRLERSGSTIVVVIITPSHLICANAGDSRAILRRDGRVLPLSFDHKPTDIPEEERIVEAGGIVRSKRVDGDLGVSRGLGDFFFKSNRDIATSRQKVIAEPDIIVYPRDNEKDEFVVLACDGIWDVATNDMCSKMIQDILDEGETNLQLVCEEVLDMCLERNSRDNMSLVFVGFPALNMCQSSLTARNAVNSRRAERQKRLLEAQARLVAENVAAGVGIKLGSESLTQEQRNKQLMQAVHVTS